MPCHQLLVCLILVGCGAKTAHAIRYKLIDGGGGNQSGHTLEGFIEFDTSCGHNCTPANVTDFTFAVSGPSNYSLSYESVDNVLLGPGPFLNVGPTNITIDYKRVGSVTLWKAPDGPLLQWHTALHSGRYISFDRGISGGWATNNDQFAVPVIGVVVPEPSGLIIVLLAIGSLATSRRRYA